MKREPKKKEKTILNTSIAISRPGILGPLYVDAYTSRAADCRFIPSFTSDPTKAKDFLCAEQAEYFISNCIQDRWQLTAGVLETSLIGTEPAFTFSNVID